MACPQYMAMGMSYAQFWDEPSVLAIDFRKAFRLKREIENEQAWLQGMYIYNAFAVALHNAFTKRGGQKLYYLEKPLDIFPLTEAQKKKREKEEYAKMQKAMEEMIRSQKSKKKSKGE